MTDVLTPSPKQAFLDNNGAPAVGYKLFTYAAGTSTKLATHTSSTGLVNNTNPVVLDYRGEASIWIPPNVSYKYVLARPSDTDPPTNPIWTVDGVVSSQLITLYGGVDTGSANAYVLNFTANFTTYTDGIIIYWVPGNTNTAASTLNVNGLGAVNLLNFNGATISPGTVVAGQIVQVMYLGGSFKIISVVPITGSFTGTLTGVSGSITGTCFYTLSGRTASVRVPAMAGTSNSTSCTVTGMPTFLSPTNGMVVPIADSSFLNNTALVSNVRALVSASFPGTITYQIAGNSIGFTAAGTKGIDVGNTITWTLT